MSTIGVEWAEKISSKLSERGIHFLDAPVTGSTPKAITGELTIFIGGKFEIFERARLVLSMMGTNLQYMGKSGM
jgi:3-hydroxyisobutyrate dehydrogenase-like beta-hydroxyacid dehydrogenase